MKTVQLIALIVLFTLSLVLSGCGGGSTEVRATNTTMGQELTDLQAAKDQGLLTDKEYEKAKQKILDRY